MRKPIPWCDLAVFLNVGCSHIVRNGQTCLYVVAPCTWTQKSSLKKLTSTHATRLVTRASKVANRTLLSAILNLKDWTGVYDVVDFKNVRFQSSTRVHQTRRIKKSILEICFKNMRFRCADSHISYGQERAVSKVSGLVWTEPHSEPELL